MLVINDNRTRLLAMKEKLLEVDKDNQEQLLEDYKTLATSIDKEIFEDLVKKIETTNYYSLSLQERLNFLTDI